ncbi:MAG: glucose-6-phosphate dehydrogenase assembly protein OpcA, partial [Nocardioides sp.]|nr:glucose-6-phosphate dehydrogenase assembly protein OpcA [Nocardioides sp.]
AARGAAWHNARPTGDAARRGPAGPATPEPGLHTNAGESPPPRADGMNATFSTPNQPDRPIALKRRAVSELLAEELRRLDEDDVYAATTRHLAGRPARRKTR